MATSLYDNQYTGTETWSTQGAAITYGQGGSTATPLPLLASQLTLTYSRVVNPFFPINSTSQGKIQYNIAGAPQGSLTLGNLLAPNTVMEAFLKVVGAGCITKEDEISMMIKPFGELKCSSSGAGTASVKGSCKITGVTLQSFGLTIQSQGSIALISVPMTFSFTGLEWTD